VDPYFAVGNRSKARNLVIYDYDSAMKIMAKSYDYETAKKLAAELKVKHDLSEDSYKTPTKFTSANEIHRMCMLPRDLSWKCRRHVATCRRRHNVSLQFWPNGSVSPAQNLRCRGSLCRLLPTFPRFSEVYNILRTFIPGPKHHPLANKLFDSVAALKLKEIQQSKRVDDDGEADV
jgi:hypothetical protein